MDDSAFDIVTWYELEFENFGEETEIQSFNTRKELQAWKKEHLFPGVPFRITKHTSKLLSLGVHG